MINVLRRLPQLQVHALHPVEDFQQIGQSVQKSLSQLVGPTFFALLIVRSGRQQVLDVIEDVKRSLMIVDVPLKFQLAPVIAFSLKLRHERSE